MHHERSSRAPKTTSTARNRYVASRLAVLAAITAFALQASAAQLTLQWTPSASGTVTGYKLFYGTSSGSYGPGEDIGSASSPDPEKRQYAKDLPAGTTYYFAVKAYDAAGNTSPFSNEAVGTTPSATTTNQAPKVTISQPATTSISVTTGSTLDFIGAATDDGPLTSLKYAWTVDNGSVGSTGTSLLGQKFDTPGKTYTVALTVTDANGAKGVATRTVSVAAATPTKPSATADTYTVKTGNTLNVASPGVLGNDTVALGKTLEAKIVSTTANGKLNLSADGSFRFTPNSGYTGNTYFTYIASDGTNFSSAATVTITVARTGTTTPTTGLVAAYGFNEGSGPTAYSKPSGVNNGTISNAVWTSRGRFGGALEFKSASKSLVNVPDSTSLRMTSGLTVEAWIKPSAISNAWTTVVYKGDDNYYMNATSPTAGRPAAGVRTATSTWAETTGTAALSTTQWTHLAMTYDSATVRLYVNGILASSKARAGTIQTSTNPLQIGGDSLFYGQYFDGLIDEVRVYNRTLTPTEILADMNTPI